MGRKATLEQERRENDINDVTFIYPETLFLNQNRENNFQRQRVKMKWQYFCGFLVVMYNYSVSRKAIEPSRKSETSVKKKRIIWELTNFGNEEGG